MIYSNADQYYFISDDSNDETYTDALFDIDSNENDNTDDVGNILPNDIEMKYDIAVFISVDNNKEESSCDNNPDDDPYD